MSGSLVWMLAAPALLGGTAEVDLPAAVEAVRSRCFECHAEGNVKGGLRLDQASGWLSSIEPGNLDDSELIYRLHLPAEDPDAMPPKGERLDPGAVKALEVWVLAGGAAAEVEGLIKNAVKRREKSAATLAALGEIVGARIEPTRAAGGQVLENQLIVTWSHGLVAPTPERMAALAPVAAQVVEIVLAKTAVTDEALSALPELPALQKLHLERTAVTDAGVRRVLAKAPSLSYLNLYSSSVTLGIQADLEALEPRLKTILFDTDAATAAGADPFARLRRHQPMRLHVQAAKDGPWTVLEETSVSRFELAADPSAVDHERSMWPGTRLAPSLRNPRIVLRLDVRGRTVGTFKSSMFKGWTLAFGTTYQELSSGALVLARMSAPDGEPWAMEVNERGDVVWSFRDDERFPKGIGALVVQERR